MTSLINLNNNNIFNTIKKMKSSTIVNNHKTTTFNRKIKKALTIKNISYNFKNNIKNELKKRRIISKIKIKRKVKRWNLIIKFMNSFFLKAKNLKF